MHRNLTGTDSARTRCPHLGDFTIGSARITHLIAPRRRPRQRNDVSSPGAGEPRISPEINTIRAERADSGRRQAHRGASVEVGFVRDGRIRKEVHQTVNEKTWSVTIVIDDYKSAETGAQTRARARLRTSDRATFVGTGLARRNPHHTDVPEVSDDMAAARALADLSHQLYEAAAQREAVTRSALTSARTADFGRRRSSA